MEYKAIYTGFKLLDDRTVEGIASVTGILDLGGDRVMPNAFKKTLKERSEKVRHLWQHDFTQPPTAKIVEIGEVKADGLPEEITKQYPEAKGGLRVVREYLDTPRGNEVLAGLKAGAIKEMSIGYDPIKVKFMEEDIPDSELKVSTRHLLEVALWDTSDVNWGMNPGTVAAKMVVPYQDTGKAAEGTSWSAPGLSDFTAAMFDDLPSGEKTRIANHFAWTANSPPSSFGDLKLGHHQAGKSGVGPAIWRGVAAAMGALMGSRGGVDIPSGDRRGVYNHLSKHYQEFDKEPPDFKVVNLVYYATLVDDPAVAFRWAYPGMSKRSLEELLEAWFKVSKILGSAKPLEEVDAQVLTESVLLRIALAEKEALILS